MPKLYIIGGCNGAGKTTGSYAILPEIVKCKEFVNADIIAYGLSPFNQESVAIEAGRIMLKRMNDLLEEGADFAFETTLSARVYLSIIKKAKALGYKITLLFFWLRSPEMAIDRVAGRVATGGHYIPSITIRRRYYRGIKNLHELYIPVCDDWILVDNTINAERIAHEIGGRLQINNYKIWSMISDQVQLAEEPQVSYGRSEELVDRIIMGIRKGYRNLVIESAARGESLVTEIDGVVKRVPAKDLLHTIKDI